MIWSRARLVQLTRSARHADDPSALMRDGEALLVAGDLGRAAQASGAPSGAALWRRVGPERHADRRTTRGGGGGAAAREGAGFARVADPRDGAVPVRLGMGRFQFLRRRPPERGRAPCAATALVPTNAMGYWQLGDVHDTLGERRPAARAARRAAARADARAGVLVARARGGVEADSARGVRFARACYRAALRLAPAHAGTLHNLATFHESQGEPERFHIAVMGDGARRRRGSRTRCSPPTWWRWC